MKNLYEVFDDFEKAKNKKEKAENKAPLSQIKIIPHKAKNEWNLVAKYSLGKKRYNADE